MTLPDPISRDEFQEILNRVRSLESKTDILLVQNAANSASAVASAVASAALAKATIWKLVAMTLIGFCLGIAPYVLHMAGVIK